MPRPSTYSFSRYLTAKTSVDDRALNRHVWNAMADIVPNLRRNDELRILEIGAGIGTMVERIFEWGLVTRNMRYTAIDSNADHIATARDRLARFALEHGARQPVSPAGEIMFTHHRHTLTVSLQTIDVELYAREPQHHAGTDLLIAHAVLDLLDVPSSLPKLVTLGADHALLYLTINFDGATILEPAIDLEYDRLVEELYHQTMGRRTQGSRPSGARYTGRHLFHHLLANDVRVIAAGSSDWVVFPMSDGYPADEAYFLHFIVHTIAGALANHPQLDKRQFDAWIETRHAQIEAGKLVYIAHQIDILAQR